MITNKDFYTHFDKSSSNSNEFIFDDNANLIFPIDGIYVGTLSSACGYQLPALIPIHKTNGLCFLSTPEIEETILMAIQKMTLRFICSVPPSKCKLILYDGQRLGENLLYLAELDSQIIEDGICTSCEQLKIKLKQVKNEISDRITHAFGSKFKGKTLYEYNAQVGIMSLPYCLIIIPNFPYTLDVETVKILKEIIKNGSRVGVYVLMNIDTTYNLEKSKNFQTAIDVEDFFKCNIIPSMGIIYKESSENRYYVKFGLNENVEEWSLFNSFVFTLDESIPHNIDRVNDFLSERIHSKKYQKLDISNMFTVENFWKANSSEGIRIPIGRDENDKVINFTLGYNSFHAKVGGMTGTGKSVVLHNIIANGAWLYSPDELQFILMDFKDGIGFKPYVDLPHTRILSLDKDPSFAQNVLDYVLTESTNRNRIFSECGVDNFADYKSANLSAMPRLLVIIDEFTSMYYGISSRDARLLNEKIDQIARTVRSTGINMIICTQGLNKLDVELSQFSLGIGLRFQSERDKRFISPDFQFPKDMEIGDAFYCDNDSAAKRFRVSYMKNDKANNQMMVNDRKTKINNMSNGYSPFERFIYNGKKQVDFVGVPKNISIGLPILCSVPIKISFNHENGDNVLIVGRSREAALSIFYHMIDQLIADDSKKKIFVCDKSAVLNHALQKLVSSNSKISNYITDDNDIAGIIESILFNVRKRQTEKWNLDIYLFLYDSFNFGKGRRSENGITTKEIEYLMEILKNGASKGVHLIVYSDSYKHYESTFGYSSLGEWRIKIALLGDDSNKIFASRSDGYDLFEDSPYAAIVDLGKESQMVEMLTFKIQ